MDSTGELVRVLRGQRRRAKAVGSLTFAVLLTGASLASLASGSLDLGLVSGGNDHRMSIALVLLTVAVILALLVAQWIGGLGLATAVDIGISASSGPLVVLLALKLFGALVSITEPSRIGLAFLAALVVRRCLTWVWSTLLLVCAHLEGCWIIVAVWLATAIGVIGAGGRGGALALAVGGASLFGAMAVLAGLKRIALAIDAEAVALEACPHGVESARARYEFCPACCSERKAAEIETEQRRSEREAKDRSDREERDARDAMERKRRLEDHNQRQRKLQSLNGLRSLSPGEFQELVWRVFEAKGYRVERSPMSRDGGVDGWAAKGESKYVLQCKRYAAGNRVGAPAIRDLFGVLMHHRATGAFIITTGQLTNDARVFVVGKPIQVIDEGSIVDWVASVTVSL